jgi:curved DNA-binding protein
MKYKDYYRTLGVERGASADEIKKAYRRLARKYHPDVSKEKNAEERFKEVGEAYDVLGDPQKRAAYDRLGHYRPGQDFRPPPEWEREFTTHGFGGGEAPDLSDFFEQLFGSMGGGRRGPRGNRFATAGADFEARVEITLEEAARGTEVRLDLSGPATGSDGRMRRGPREIAVRIPKGVTDGQKLRVPGKGGPGTGGGPAGALHLSIALRPHRLFRPEGHDLYLDLPLAPWEAVLGASVEIPTLEGKVRLRIPAGAGAGQKFRLAGRGLPHPRGGAGDLYAVVRIVTPGQASSRERELYEALARESTFDPRAKLE